MAKEGSAAHPLATSGESTQCHHFLHGLDPLKKGMEHLTEYQKFVKYHFGSHNSVETFPKRRLSFECTTYVTVH